VKFSQGVTRMYRYGALESSAMAKNRGWLALRHMHFQLVIAGRQPCLTIDSRACHPSMAKDRFNESVRVRYFWSMYSSRQVRVESFAVTFRTQFAVKMLSTAPQLSSRFPRNGACRLSTNKQRTTAQPRSDRKTHEQFPY
jgi:hypothetical protein